ncbi:MAG TPA: hypothetical protein VI913_03315 [Candidatus Peribacteraceae bacterium]|nr:hypothetical protein [Candidatus Peribacteraceae bacterium]
MTGMDAVALEPTLKSLERQFCNPQTWVKYLLEDDEIRAQVAVSNPMPNTMGALLKNACEMIERGEDGRSNVIELDAYRPKNDCQ